MDIMCPFTFSIIKRLPFLFTYIDEILHCCKLSNTPSFKKSVQLISSHCSPAFQGFHNQFQSMKISGTFPRERLTAK